MLSYKPTFFTPEKPLPERETAAYQTVQRQITAGKLGFAKLPYASTSEIQALADHVAAEVASVIVIGIGGSDLGTRAVQRMLNHQYYNFAAEYRNGRPQLFFAGDTTDPVPLQEIMDVVDLSKTTLVMVSKSGNTLEQMATFILLRDRVIAAVGSETAKQRIITVTDPETGLLRKITDQEGYRSLSVPQDVGGRFSVLSAVGLFPLAIAGIAIDDLLAGAREIAEMDESSQAASLPLQFATHQYLAFTQGMPMSVLFAYTYSMREFGLWYRQIWAESLGKKLSRSGKEVCTGPTPIAAVGPTDQHSQVQLYIEGPKDKIITFVTVEESFVDLELPRAFETIPSISYLGGKHMKEVVQHEALATAKALHLEGRPSVSLSVTKLDAHHVGMLLYFFELATAYGGEFWDVNAYDQPGVEHAKILMNEAMGKPTS
ncbi:glucose-6-phosphate isomerase [soil metagenome]